MNSGHAKTFHIGKKGAIIVPLERSWLVRYYTYSLADFHQVKLLN